LITPGDLLKSILPPNNFFAGQSQNESPIVAGTESLSKGEEQRDQSVSEKEGSNAVKDGVNLPLRQSTDPPTATTPFLNQIPFQYVHDRLRIWGVAYLGSTVTADAFVNAVHLRRPSMALMKEGYIRDESDSTGKVTIRARVLPRAKERKPFLIQRQFDIDELRAGIPQMQQPPKKLDHISSVPLRRSPRSSRLASASTHHLSIGHRRASADSRSEQWLTPLGAGAVPIHVEYALHYLPVLGALMLSGHIRRGDTIDLPMPQPEAWRDVVSHIYTGKGEITDAMKQNISFLAGKIE